MRRKASAESINEFRCLMTGMAINTSMTNPDPAAMNLFHQFWF